MNKPNFLIIGAAKAGTTSLFHYMKQHPQIYMAPGKETNFFALEGEKLNFCGPGDDLDTNSFSITKLENYQNLFQGVAGQIAIGEASPFYLYSEKAPLKIFQYDPKMKMIVILRHPVERAYSNFLHFSRGGREPFSDFNLAIDNEQNRIDNNWQWLWHYVQLGFYYIQIQRYLQFFDRSQLKICFHEDLEKNPNQLICELFNFLGVDESFIPDISTRHNVSGLPKNKFWQSTLQTILIKSTFVKPISRLLLKPETRLKIASYMLSQNLSKPQLSPDIRQKLIRIYREDILKLQDLLQRDLSHWLQ
ncbi:MAG: sulfotransferase domain-containing protein [Oscillatoriaceae cyanobacterium]